MEHFCYRGFLPVKSGQRARELGAAANREETTVFFESPYRINKTLVACADLMPARQLCVARELTKKFEEFRRGTAAELLAHYEKHPARGEITLLVEGHDIGEWTDAVDSLLVDPARRSDLGRRAAAHAQEFGWGATTDHLLEVYAEARRVRTPTPMDPFDEVVQAPAALIP